MLYSGKNSFMLICTVQFMQACYQTGRLLYEMRVNFTARVDEYIEAYNTLSSELKTYKNNFEAVSKDFYR